jgi:hypothetical protein
MVGLEKIDDGADGFDGRLRKLHRGHARAWRSGEWLPGAGVNGKIATSGLQRFWGGSHGLGRLAEETSP